MKMKTTAFALALCLPGSSALAHDANYYTDYTNAATSLSLSLAPTEATYWDGSTVNLQVAGYGCRWGSPGAMLVIHCLFDDTEIATTNMYWGAFSPNLVTNPIPLGGLPVGTHTITAQQTNSIEYYTEYRFLYSSTHLNFWHTITYYHNYYAVDHYRTVPCSAAQTFTVLPSPNFHRLQADVTNSLITFTYTGVPTSNYWFYLSDDLAHWYLHSGGKASTNGRVKFYDATGPGHRFYRSYGP